MTVIIAFFILAINALAVFGFGVFLKPLSEEFGWDRGALSGAFALGAVFTGALAVITGRLADRYGPRRFAISAGILIGTGFILMSQISALWQAYLIWGPLIGAGIGCAVIPTNSSIPRWFTKKRGVAISITIAGFNFGAVIGPLIIQWLISTYDWRQAFLILGAVPILVDVPLALFLKKDPRQMGITAYGEEEPANSAQPAIPAKPELPFSTIVRSRIFWVFGGLQFAFGFGMQTVIIHIVPNAQDAGIPALIAASILSITAGSRVIGTLSSGVVSERLGSRRVMTGSFVLMALAFAWLIFAKSAAGFFVFAVMFGVTSGGINPLLTLVPAELFGLRNLGIISGVFLLLGTLGGALGSPLAGYIFDVSGSYTVAFAVALLIAIIAIILSVVLLRHNAEAADSEKLPAPAYNENTS